MKHYDSIPRIQDDETPKVCYKVTVGVNWFTCPTSCNTEGVIKTLYIQANSEDEVKEIIQNKYKGRFTPYKFEII